MKWVIVSLSLSVIGFGLLSYVYNNLPLLSYPTVQSLVESREINSQSEVIQLVVILYRRGIILEYISRDSLYLFAGGVALFAFGLSATIHMGIDKLFFRRHYEDVRVALAIRRGSIITLLTITLGYMWLVYQLQPLLIIVVILVGLGIELLVSSAKPRLAKENESVKIGDG